MKNIILVAYKFPPYNEVGSNRWEHLSYELAKIGFKIDVITVDWGSTPVTNQHENIIIHKIKSGYPHRLKYYKFKIKMINVLKNLFFRIIDRLFCFDDEAQNWGKYLNPYLENLIHSKKINCVIATGGPFQATRWCATMRSKVKFKLIVDFRDCWASNKIKDKTYNQNQQIYQWQKFTVSNADYIVAISKTLLIDFLNGDHSKPGSVITNGYPESFTRDVATDNLHNLSTSQINIVHLGNVTNEREIPLFSLLKVLLENIDLNRITIKLIGNMSLLIKHQIESEFSELIKSGQLLILPPVPKEKVLSVINESSYTLHLNSPTLDYAHSTKVFEYCAAKKPCLSINYGGESDLLISENDWGVSVNLNRDNLYDKLKLLLNSPSFQFKNREKYAFKELAKEYARVIESLDPM